MQQSKGPEAFFAEPDAACAGDEGLWDAQLCAMRRLLCHDA